MAEELEVYEQASQAMRELLDRSKICPGEIVVVGCSTSEVLGHQIGTTSSMEVAGSVVQRPLLRRSGNEAAIWRRSVVSI